MLRIKGWEQYENSRTRQYDKLDWVPVPNTMDGDGYTALLDHKHGAAHLAAWYTLLAVASRRPRGLRGTLLRDCGKPHDAHSLSRMTRIPAAIYQEAIPRLLSPEIGWLEEFQQADSALTAPCQQAVSEPSAPCSLARAQNELKELNEENEQKRTNIPPPANGTKPPPVTEEERARLVDAKRKDLLKTYRSARQWTADQLTQTATEAVERELSGLTV